MLDAFWILCMVLDKGPTSFFPHVDIQFPQHHLIDKKSFNFHLTTHEVGPIVLTLLTDEKLRHGEISNLPKTPCDPWQSWDSDIGNPQPLLIYNMLWHLIVVLNLSNSFNPFEVSLPVISCLSNGDDNIHHLCKDSLKWYVDIYKASHSAPTQRTYFRPGDIVTATLVALTTSSKAWTLQGWHQHCWVWKRWQQSHWHGTVQRERLRPTVQRRVVTRWDGA